MTTEEESGHRPTLSQPIHTPRLVVAFTLAAALAGCASYEPAPVDAAEILADLRAGRFASPSGEAPADAEGADLEQLAAFAVTHNPALRAIRARIGVGEALLVEAGLLANPTIGWDGMDALASQIVEGTTSSVDFLAGLGVSFPLPRPGELDAKEGAARWRVEQARRQVALGEWRLARDVFVTCEELREVQRILEQNEELLRVAESTREYFNRARSAGAATAMQANLAAGELLAIRAERVRLESRLRDARQRLNGLLGLPPSADFPILAAQAREPEDELELGPEAIVDRSLTLRPDLAELMAAYQAAEEEVRLEVKRQFPQISIGTGIWLVPGFFTRFNRPAIATAVARREALRHEFEAQVHEVRREIHDAHAAFEEARRLLDFLESELLPNAEKGLRLAGTAFEAGEVTLIEILTMQRSLVDARTRTTEARAEFRRRLWQLRAAGGLLLTTTKDPASPVSEREVQER
ncbi:MAG: hypothetical protein CMJ94_08380 [Planctomycetes bacterium]|nr:hypothetical protein [Planctomycetota bacterium]